MRFQLRGYEKNDTIIQLKAYLIMQVSIDNNIKTLDFKYLEDVLGVFKTNYSCPLNNILLQMKSRM